MSEPLKWWTLLITIVSSAFVSILAVVLLCGCFQVPDLKVHSTILSVAANLVIIVVGAVVIYRLVRCPVKITAALMANVLHAAALSFIIVVVVVATMSVTAPEESSPPDGSVLGEDVVPPEDGVEDGDLFTAAATIMALAVFGSALGTLGSNKHLIRGIAYTLIPLITVQAAFMLHLVGIIYFPVVLWILMTAILLMLAVLAMVASKLIPDQTEGSAAAPET